LQVSVLVLGVDSVSRLNAERLWPKTQQSLQEMNAVTLLGYNKVADNTFPNLVPVLIGQSVEDLNDVCGWPSKSKAYLEKFDDCPFLWRTFSELGFRTMLAEECSHLTTFNFQVQNTM
jgi:hypothetical protein